MNPKRPNGPRCVICGRPFVARMMQNGMMTQTCGNTACVSALSRRRNADFAPRAPRANYNPAY